MGYIAYIDYNSLDNSLFLKSLAGATAKQDSGIKPRIFVHGDSEYTERLIQTGMMREDAQSRAVRELNRRLVALFADYGVSAIGLNGYQRKVATFNPDSDELTIDHNYLLSLPSPTILIISNLIHIVGEKKPQFFPIPRYLTGLKSIPGISHLFTFSGVEKSSSDDFGQSEGQNATETEKKDKKQHLSHELTDIASNAEKITVKLFTQITDN